jgi:hypothetical protein
MVHSFAIKKNAARQKAALSTFSVGNIVVASEARRSPHMMPQVR